MLKRKAVRYLLIFSAILIVGLAFTPHYGMTCACGKVYQRDGTILTHLLEETFKFIGRNIPSF